MPFKGFNSILFDFDSIIDIELSYMNFLINEYRDTALDWLNKNKLICTTIGEWQYQRMYGPEDAFQSIISDDSMRKNSSRILKLLFERDEKEVLKEYAHPTAMQILIKTYKKAGDGVIKTAVRCDNETQAEYVKMVFRDSTDIEICDRKDIDMPKYGRLIVGNYKDALEYKIEEPKSILVLNFKENFDEKDSTQLNLELVIKLGDINDINIVSAYRPEIND